MNKFFYAICIILLTGWLSNIHAQTVIYGKVIDTESGKGIPYANVQINNTALGTACNQNGEFLLSIIPEYYNESIKISCIGYSNRTISIQDLLNDFKAEHLIRLDPFTQNLDEITVEGIRESPEDFLKRAFNAIPKNYIQKPFNMEIYSKMTVKDSVKEFCSIESISLLYKEGYIPGAFYNSKILQNRITGTIPSPFYDYNSKIDDLFPWFPEADISNSDRIGLGEIFKYSVFNPDDFRKLNLRYVETSIYDKDTVVAIEYSRKDLRGMIYIASNNLAIIRHTRNGMSYDYNFNITYKNVNGYYFPYTITTKQIALHDPSISIIDEIVIKNIEINGVVQFKSTNGWYPKDIPYDEEFWHSNYPIREDLKIENEKIR